MTFVKTLVALTASWAVILGTVSCYESGHFRLDVRDDPAGEAADFPVEAGDQPVEVIDSPLKTPDPPTEILDSPVENIDPPVDTDEPEFNGICPGGIYVPEGGSDILVERCL